MPHSDDFDIGYAACLQDVRRIASQMCALRNDNGPVVQAAVTWLIEELEREQRKRASDLTPDEARRVQELREMVAQEAATL